jgi:hypothetical protein
MDRPGVVLPAAGSGGDGGRHYKCRPIGGDFTVTAIDGALSICSGVQSQEDPKDKVERPYARSPSLQRDQAVRLRLVMDFTSNAMGTHYLAEASRSTPTATEEESPSP